jgi:FLVCR family MFS transporter 7
MVRPIQDNPSVIELTTVFKSVNPATQNSELVKSLAKFKVYKTRWYILTVICLANISNAINWIIYGSIADSTARYYSIDYDQVNFLSLVYMIIAIPSGFFSFWFIDNFGIRTSINLGSWFNLIGAVIKVLTSLDSADGKPLIDKNNAYAVLMVGQSLCALAQPFLIFISAKFANSWFAEDQRAIADALCLGSSTLGILVGSVVSPFIIDIKLPSLSGMGLLHVICCALSFLPAIMACFIFRSTPLQPPSYSALISKNGTDAAADNQPSTAGGNKHVRHFKLYLHNVNKLFKSNDFMILFVCFGFGLGLFNALSTLIQQVTCIRGYTDNDAGYFGACMIVAGIIGSVIAGFIVDKNKKLEEMAKICFVAATVSNLAFCLFQLKNNDNDVFYYLSLVSIGFFGLFGLPLLPVCMEMSVECVFPVPEATATGLLFTAGKQYFFNHLV